MISEVIRSFLESGVRLQQHVFVMTSDSRFIFNTSSSNPNLQQSIHEDLCNGNKDKDEPNPSSSCQSHVHRLRGDLHYIGLTLSQHSGSAFSCC